MTTATIHPDTTLGRVHLTVSDLEQSLAFYQQRLGFALQQRNGATAVLGAGQAELLVLTENRQARRQAGTTGLYHFAILVPSRLELAQVLRRIAKTRTPVQGFADHGVSEAIYLPDPDGNGIELYRDRTRQEWPIGENGELQMVVDPLDTEGLLALLAGHDEAWAGLHPGSVLGHMHLHVSNLAEAETFYREVLGFGLMQRFGGSASFLSAGGYHHHLGINTWAGVGAPPPAENSVGLREYVIKLPDEAALQAVIKRATQAGVELQTRDVDHYFLRDPAHNGLVLTT